MKKLILFMVLMFGCACFADVTNTVSTFNMNLRVKHKKPFVNYILWKITSEDEAKRALDFSMDHLNDSMLLVLMTTLSARDYTRENCYVLFGVCSKDLSFANPYSINDDKKLYFEMNRKEKYSYWYVPTSIYWADKDKDVFTKIILIDGKEIIPVNAP